MRQRVTALRLLEFMRALGTEVKIGARVYLVGGATAVLLGCREATLDIDLSNRAFIFLDSTLSPDPASNRSREIAIPGMRGRCLCRFDWV